MGSYVVMPVTEFIALLQNTHTCSKGNPPKLNLNNLSDCSVNNIKLTTATFECCDITSLNSKVTVIDAVDDESCNLSKEINKVMKSQPIDINGTMQANLLGFHIELENMLVKSEESVELSSLEDSCEIIIEEKDPLAFEDEGDDDVSNKKEHIPDLLMWSAKSSFINHTDEGQRVDLRKKYPESFTCEFCGKSFTGKDRAYSFYLHRNREHTQEMAYKCSVCFKNFWGERELSAHIASHHGSSYVCHICGKELASKKTLNVHVLIHSDRKFTCSYCGKQFVRNDHLKVHLRIHTGIRPYQCKKCDSGFTQKHQLKLHRKRCPLVIKECKIMNL